MEKKSWRQINAALTAARSGIASSATASGLQRHGASELLSDNQHLSPNCLTLCAMRPSERYPSERYHSPEIGKAFTWTVMHRPSCFCRPTLSFLCLRRQFIQLFPLCPLLAFLFSSLRVFASSQPWQLQSQQPRGLHGKKWPKTGVDTAMPRLPWSSPRSRISKRSLSSLCR